MTRLLADATFLPIECAPIDTPMVVRCGDEYARAKLTHGVWAYDLPGDLIEQLHFEPTHWRYLDTQTPPA